MKAFLKNGADVNARNYNGETALIRAAESGRTAAVTILLAYQANGNAADIAGTTSLMRAAYRGHVDVAIHRLQGNRGGRRIVRVAGALCGQAIGGVVLMMIDKLSRHGIGHFPQ